MSIESGQHYIYLIRASNGLYKIGRTKDIKRRFRTLQDASPCELEMIIAAGIYDASAGESKLHGYFAEKRAHGEWFHLADSDVDTIKKLLAQWDSNPMSERDKQIVQRRKAKARKARERKEIDLTYTNLDAVQYPSHFLTTKEAAEHLGIDVHSIDRICRDGGFPLAVQDNTRHWHIPIDDLETYKFRRKWHVRTFSEEEIREMPSIVEKAGGITRAAQALGKCPKMVRKALRIAQELEKQEGTPNLKN